MRLKTLTLWPILMLLPFVYAHAQETGAVGVANKLRARASHYEPLIASAAQRYNVDPMHSTIGFATTLLRAVKVRGRFTAYDATIIYDQAHLERSSVTAVMQALGLLNRT